MNRPAELHLAFPVDGPCRAYLDVAFVLDVEDRKRGIIGALIAFPPGDVTADILARARPSITNHTAGPSSSSLAEPLIPRTHAVAVNGSAQWAAAVIRASIVSAE